MTEKEGSPTYVVDFWLGPCRLGFIAVPGPRAAEAGKDVWPDTGVCFRYLVRVNFSSGYLAWDQFQLSTSITPIGVLGRECPVEGWDCLGRRYTVGMEWFT